MKSLEETLRNNKGLYVTLGQNLFNKNKGSNERNEEENVPKV